MAKEKDLKNAFEKTMKKHKGNKKAQLITIIVFAIIAIFSAFFGKDIVENNLGNTKGNIEISYLDVGQGDAAYIRVNDLDILIDAGPRSDSDKLMKQLEEKNIDDFEIVIATHPHEDHIGGMVKVFEKYDVESFYMPKVTNTTKTFENMINAVSKEGLKAKVIKEGTSFDLGNGAKIEVYSPIYESYEEFNDYSPIMKLTFGNTSYMFTGDAEAHAEQEVVAKYPKNLDADVLKFGHHGSSTSSTKEFVEAVSPEYGVISCGVDNKYGHPHRETLQTIDTQGIKAYRTDKQGQITITSDGNTISVRTEK